MAPDIYAKLLESWFKSPNRCGRCCNDELHLGLHCIFHSKNYNTLEPQSHCRAQRENIIPTGWIYSELGSFLILFIFCFILWLILLYPGAQQCSAMSSKIHYQLASNYKASWCKKSKQLWKMLCGVFDVLADASPINLSSLPALKPQDTRHSLASSATRTWPSWFLKERVQQEEENSLKTALDEEEINKNEERQLTNSLFLVRPPMNDLRNVTSWLRARPFLLLFFPWENLIWETHKTETGNTQ